MAAVSTSSKLKFPAPVLKESRIPRLTPATRTRIPVSVLTSKKVSTNNSSQAEKMTKINRIKPIITKKAVPLFKEFSTKTGPKPVLKGKKFGRKSLPKAQNVKKQRQTTLKVEDFKSKRPMIKIEDPEWLEIKENVSPTTSNYAKFINEQPVAKSAKMMHKEFQNQLNFEFEPNEFYRNQILNNKELSPSQLRPMSASSSMHSGNKPDAYEPAVTQIQHLGSAKSSTAKGIQGLKPPQQRVKFESCESSRNMILNNKKFSPKMLRRCTWSSALPSKGPSKNLPNHRESAIARLELNSCLKPTVKSRTIQKPWTLRQSDRRESIGNHTPTKAPDAYEIAMQRIQELRSSKKKNSIGTLESRQSIEFEPCEFSRNMILNNKKLTPAMLRSCTRSSDLPSKCQRNTLLNYCEGEIASVERRSSMKSSVKSKTVQMPWASLRPSGKFESVFNSSPAKVPDAYEIAMQRIQELRSKKRDSIGNLESSTTLGRQSSIYRPLHSMLPASASNNKFRLTDISEKSENDESNLFDSESLEEKVNDISSKLDEVKLQLSLEKSREISSVLRVPCITNASSSSKLSLDQYRYSQSKMQEPFKCLDVSPQPSTPVSNSAVHHLHTPRPVSFYSKTKIPDNSMLFAHKTATKETFSHCAPICTPLVLQNIARKNEEKEMLSPLRQKLNFDQEDEDINDVLSRIVNQKKGDNLAKWNSCVFSSIKHIPTKRKLDAILADEECALIMSKQQSSFSSCRNLYNPVARILTLGDDMHFVPLNHLMDTSN